MVSSSSESGGESSDSLGSVDPLLNTSGPPEEPPPKNLRICKFNLVVPVNVVDPDPEPHQIEVQDPDPDPHQDDEMDLDPHHIKSQDPDPHQSDKLDPDPHQIKRKDPDPDRHQSDKLDQDPLHLQMTSQNVWNMAHTYLNNVQGSEPLFRS
jgi:hypothetical protein